MAVTKKIIKKDVVKVVKDIKCVCLKNITTIKGAFKKDEEVILTEAQFKHFDKSKAVKKV